MAATKKASASSKGLEDLFLDGLKDIYYAEKKIVKALPKMAKGAVDEQVTAAFEKHLAEQGKQHLRGSASTGPANCDQTDAQNEQRLDHRGGGDLKVLKDEGHDEETDDEDTADGGERLEERLRLA